MKYVIKGSLYGYLCEECTEVLSGIEVLLYLPWKKDRLLETTVADVKETFRLVEREEKTARKELLIASVKTDEKGNFEFSLDEKYTNATFDIDFICGTVPRKPPKPNLREPLQFHLTTFYPKWLTDKQKESYYFNWQYGITSKWWCYIRGHYFDAWVICGHLRNCTTGKPISNAIVTAWDADLITDDNLGSDVTDANGYFRIDYTSADFKINFIPLNLETDPSGSLFSSGPDVYFKAEIGGVPLINETSANRRDNVGYCLCVKLCTDINVVDPQNPSFPSAWTGIGNTFKISVGTPIGFDADGYAGTGKYALTGIIKLTGQAAVKSLAGNPIEYRFLISDTTSPNGGPPPPLAGFTKIVGVTSGLFVPSTVATLVDKVSYDPYPVESDQSDFDAEGWFDINNAINRTLVTYGLGSILNYFLIDDDTLISMNTAALTSAPDVNPNVANAGDVFPAGSKIPIEKIAIRFEIREVINKAASIFGAIGGNGKTLNSALINNNSAFLKFSIQELETLGNCSPISGTLHAKYTVHHPHLQSVSIDLRKNGETSTKQLSDSFIALFPNTNPAVNAGNNGSLQINSVPNDLKRCTYELNASVSKRLHNGELQVGNDYQRILFFYDI